MKLAWQIREVRTALVRTRDTAGTSAGNTRSDLVLPTMYHILCNLYHIPCTMFHAPCTMYLVLCTMYHVLCTTLHSALIEPGPRYKAGQLHGWLVPVCGQRCGQRSHLHPGAPDWVELNGQISRSCGPRGHLCCGGNCLLPCTATIAATSKQGFAIYSFICQLNPMWSQLQINLNRRRRDSVVGRIRGYPD